MNRFILMLGAVGLGLNASVEAHPVSASLPIIHPPTGPTYRTTYSTILWTVSQDAPFAVWHGVSEKSPGNEVSFDGQGGEVDSAPLRTDDVYALEDDLTAGGKTVLPKGTLIVKLVGAGGNWFCSYGWAPRKSDVCLKSNFDGSVSAARGLYTNFPTLLTLNSVARFEKKFPNPNSVTIQRANANALPVRSFLQVIADWKKSNGATVCLHGELSTLRTQEQCFSQVGQSLTLAGGVYTLISQGSDQSFKIRLDKPLNISGLAPRVVN